MFYFSLIQNRTDMYNQNNLMKKILIIGGGFAGCSSAEIISKIPGTKITLIEKSKKLGAGVRTHFSGGHPFTFGPRHFLTTKK